MRVEFGMLISPMGEANDDDSHNSYGDRYRESGK